MSPILTALTPTVLLYGLCSALLLATAAFVIRRDGRDPVHRYFALTAMSLLAWVATLFVFHRTDPAAFPASALWLGRLNFAAVPFAAAFGFMFVAALARRRVAGARTLLSATAALALVTALTPLVDRAELAGPGGRHVTIYGALFLPYLLFIFACLAAAVRLAFAAARGAHHPVRDQLLLVGARVLATGTVALVCNALLPFAFGDFRFTDAGALSSLLFLLAVGYAVLRHRLFDLRLFVHKTLIYGLLLSLVLAAYSSLVVLVSDRTDAESKGAFTRFGVLVIAFSLDPVRRFLEHRADRLLFPRGGQQHRRRSARGKARS